MKPSRSKTTQPQTLRMAFIGAGAIAEHHLTALKQIPRVQVVALADVNEKSMLDKAQRFGIDNNHLFTDYRHMLQTIKPDAVNICTPNGLHAPAAIAASNAGAHVMVEKPLAMHSNDGLAMLKAAQRANRKFVIGFQMRLDPRTQFLRRIAQAGRLGQIHFGRVQALRRRGIPNWGVFGRKDLQGGGPLIDIGVHVLEMAHYVMGSPKPVAAVGKTATYLGNKPANKILCLWAGWDHKSYTVEDLAVGHIRFDNGAVLHVETMFAGHIEKNVMDFQLMGEKGGCTWSKPEVFCDQDGHMINVTPGWLPTRSFEDLVKAKLEDFVAHVLDDTPTVAPGEHGIMIQQMLDAIYASAEQGGKEIAIQ